MSWQPHSELAHQIAALTRIWVEGQDREPDYSASLLRSVLTTVPEFILLTSADGRVLYVNRTRPGTPLSLVLGSSLFDFLPDPADRERLQGAFDEARSSCRSTLIVGVPARLIGAVRIYDARIGVLVENDTPVGFTVAAADVTEQRLIERALRESETKLRLAIAATGMGIWTWDCKSDVVIWDEQLCKIFGIAIEQAPTDYASYRALIYPPDADGVVASVGRALDTGVYEDVVHRVLRPDNDLRWVLIKGAVERNPDGTPRMLYGGVLDITERRRMEERTRESQKMEALGELAAGVAHNFNNMLAGVISNLERTVRLVPPELVPGIEDALSAAGRAAEVVSRLVRFAGSRRTHELTVEPLNPVIKRVAAMCQTTFDRKIELTVAPAAADVGARMHASDIEQALLNLCLNARDALARVATPRPRIRIECAIAERGSPEVRQARPGAADDFVRLRVIDNGPGVPADLRSRIFEPFFSTKGDGGSGLGLASAFATAVEHRGWLTCEEAPPGGACFSLYLPLVRAVGEAAAVPAAHEATPVFGTLLLVDDEEIVRRALSSLLRELGFTVLEASDGSSALDLYARRGSEISVVLLDRSMPRMSGAEVLDRLVAYDPAVRVVLMSGYASDPAKYPKAAAVLSKPVSLELLQQTLHDLMAR